MIIKRNKFEKLNDLDLSQARLLYICPECGVLSHIQPGDNIVDDYFCDCGEVMELLLIEVE